MDVIVYAIIGPLAIIVSIISYGVFKWKKSVRDARYMEQEEELSFEGDNFG